MQSVPRSSAPRLTGEPAPVSGGARGEHRGDRWLSISGDGAQVNLLPRVMLAVAGFSARYSDQAARLAVPVDLRRHLPGLRSTMNYTSMLHCDISPSVEVDGVKQQLKQLLGEHAHNIFHPKAQLLKLIPLTWMDRLLGRKPGNVKKRKPIETAVVTNLGHLDSSGFSSDEFSAQDMTVVPVQGCTMLTIASMDNRLRIAVGTEEIHASDGRLSALTKAVESCLGEQETGIKGV